MMPEKNEKPGQLPGEIPHMLPVTEGGVQQAREEGRYVDTSPEAKELENPAKIAELKKGLEKRYDQSEVLPKEMVEQIEASSFDSDDKINILLALTGEKPASVMNPILITDSQEERQEDIKKFLRESVALLDRLQLPYSIKWTEDPNGLESGDQRPVVSFGKDRVSLQALEKAKTRKEWALAIGFPETAVNAYCQEFENPDVIEGYENPYLIDRKDLPPEIQEIPALAFAKFAMSKDHWQEELAFSQRLSESVRKNSPALFTARMENFLKNKDAGEVEVIE